MAEWYLGLSILEYVYFYVAIIATVFLVVQIILMCFSFGGDMDVDGDADVDIDGLSIFTVKSMTAFFAVGGWAGLFSAALLPNYLWASALIGVASGAVAMFAVYFVMRGILKLQCDGTLQPQGIVGMNATVYVSIPAKRTGHGKITLNAQGRFAEFDAVTNDEQKLLVDENVAVIAVEGDCAVVSRIKEQ